MKKLILILFSVFLVTGCTLFSANTSPTRAVEGLFGKYQSLDTEVSSQLNEIVAKEDLTDKQKEEYQNLMKKQYQNLTYTVKDEVIDGNNAIVTVEIEVFDFNKEQTAIDTYLESNPNKFETEAGAFSNEKYMDYKIEQLSKVTDRIKYTLDVSVKKTNDEWQVQDLSEVDRRKINGVYSNV